jgi:hypothetical protein
MAYKIHYSDYVTASGPPDPERWRGPPGPPGPIGPEGPGKAIIGTTPSVDTFGLLWWDSNSGQLFVQYDDGSSVQWVSANSIDASTLEGSFLPITGGTMSGPLNYTATGGTVSRAAQDRAVEAISVKDFGAKGDGTTNDTAALQAAADAIPANGGGLMFPPGRYAVTGSVRLSSNTSVIGTGATLLAISGFPINTAFLVNKNNSVTVLTDHDISVRGMTFDYATFGTGGSHAISMNFASNILIADCIFQCRGNAGNATACVGCVNTRIDGCSRSPPHQRR